MILAFLGQSAFAQNPSTNHALAISDAPLNKLLSLAGNGDYVSIPNAATLQISNAITVEAWIYPIQNTNNRNAYFISKGAGANMSGGKTFEFYWTPDNRAYFSIFTGESTWSLLASPVSESQWTHIAATYEGTEGRFRLYTNGVLAAATTNDVTGQFPLKGEQLRQNASPVVLGCSFEDAPVPGTFVTGQMDEISIWGRALSGDEIMAGIGRWLTGAEVNLVAYWNFDDGIPKDASGNEHDGTLAGNARIVPMDGFDTLHNIIGFTGASFDRRGKVVVEMTVRNGVDIRVDASTNLIDWFRVAVVQNAGGTVQFTDPETLNFSQRFYRLDYTQALSQAGTFAPQIKSQPQAQKVTAGTDVDFTVLATGTRPMLYQWRFSGTNITGATNAHFSIAAVVASDAGEYSVFVSNLAGGVISQAGVLTVDPPLHLVWIAPGTFQSAFGQTTISRGFWMSKYETTQGEYLALMDTNPSYFNGDRTSQNLPNYGTDLARPVEMVSWIDATAYCAKLTTRERAAGRLPDGYVYRLPTEAEWEYACRAGTRTRFCYGDDSLVADINDWLHPQLAGLRSYAWYSFNSGLQTHPVGLKSPNDWGLHDMHGNASEWCLDWYNNNYSGWTLTDPQGPVTGEGHVIRGGSWELDGSSCTSAYRGGFKTDGRDTAIGFRPVSAHPIQ